MAGVGGTPLALCPLSLFRLRLSAGLNVIMESVGLGGGRWGGDGAPHPPRETFQ